MAKQFGPQIKKLQNAINDKYDKKILVNTVQYYSKKLKRTMSIIVIKQAQWNEDRQVYENVQLFSSPSDIQIVLWLRDYWYKLEGIPIPEDNPQWIEARRKYEEKYNNKN